MCTIHHVQCFTRLIFFGICYTFLVVTRTLSCPSSRVAIVPWDSFCTSHPQPAGQQWHADRACIHSLVVAL